MSIIKISLEKESQGIVFNLYFEKLWFHQVFTFIFNYIFFLFSNIRIFLSNTLIIIILILKKTELTTILTYMYNMNFQWKSCII